MALYANENGTLQQLSDKSPGSNPYAQLEVVYSRNFVDDPLTFNSSMANIEHEILTNKPINEYHNLIAVNGNTNSSYAGGFQAFNLKYISIPATYKYGNPNYISIELASQCSMIWALPDDKTSNVLKYKYYTSYPSSNYSVSTSVWDFYLI